MRTDLEVLTDESILGQIIRAIKNLQNGRTYYVHASGTDGILPEFLKCAVGPSNYVYRSGRVFTEW